MAADTVLTPGELTFLADARTGVLGTVGPDGRPRLVPICYALDPARTPLRVYTPLDDKPKHVADLHDLGRVRDIAADPAVTLLVDRWSEDWAHLAWLRLDGRAELLEPAAIPDRAEHAAAVVMLRAKYPQYASHDLEARPIIRILVERVRSWGDLDGGAG